MPVVRPMADAPDKSPKCLGNKWLFRANASHHNSTLNTGSQSLNVRFLAICFSFTPDCGRSVVAVCTARCDPMRKSKLSIYPIHGTGLISIIVVDARLIQYHYHCYREHCGTGIRWEFPCVFAIQFLGSSSL